MESQQVDCYEFYLKYGDESPVLEPLNYGNNTIRVSDKINADKFSGGNF